jgi:hypothetical protein
MIGSASIVGKVVDPILHAGGKVLGGVAGAAAAGVMDQVTSWMTDAAKSIDGFVMHVALATTTPQLGAAWFGDLFGWLTGIALPFAALFAVAGIGAAGLLHNGRMLGQTVYGIVRAGWGTGVAVALVVIGVAAVSAVTSDIAAQVPAEFFQGLSTGWGASGFGGLAASALAFLVALVTVIAGIAVWLELLFRMAALYVAVATLPLVLAAAIYPPLAGLLARMLRFLVVMLIFPVIVETVLLIGAAVVGGGASLSGGIASAAATNMAGAMVFVMAALSPWATLKLVGLEGGMSSSGAGAGAAAAAGGAAGGAAVILAGAQNAAAATSARMDAAHGGQGQASGGMPSMPSMGAGSGSSEGASEAPTSEAAAAA